MRTVATTFLVLLGFCPAVQANVKPAGMFGDRMVLQRDRPVPVWGWADPGETVSVTIAGQTQTATADRAGKWSVRLDALKAGGPHELTIRGKNTVQFKDVLVGEVWLCSGQSNMEMVVAGVLNKDVEIAAGNYPNLRIFNVPGKTAEVPQENCEGIWQACSPKNVPWLSATAYFFGRRLHQELNVPVGIFNASQGGTPIQAWTSLAAQEATPELAPLIAAFKKTLAAWDPQAAQKHYEKLVAEWEQAAAAAKAAGKPFTLRKPDPKPGPGLLATSPARLYNGMIAPLAPYAIRGVVWYQGEANADAHAGLYGVQLRTLIANWRQIWHAGDFPFLFVQLPNFMAPQKLPSETGPWPRIREQMLKTLAVPQTGMAITIDVGEADEIHPRNKQAVAHRLAQWALAKTYGKDLVACGPLYKAMQPRGDKIELAFEFTGGRLSSREGGNLKGFAIAGADRKFVWAEARIVDDKVMVSSPEVKAPVAVRYAWANNPDGNLINKAKLPASPFRTDDWDQ